MWKSKSKLQDFVKRQVAKVLAVVMAFSSFASTGMSLATVHADPSYVNDGGAAFVQKVVSMASKPTKYVWGGWSESGVDCRGMIRVALKNVYGLNIQQTYGYLVDDDGNPVDLNGNRVSQNNKVYVDVAPWDALYSWRNLKVGTRICVEGNGIRTYYRMAANGTCADLQNIDNEWVKGSAIDIHTNSGDYSSIIAYACRFPGSLITHNGHWGVALGQFNSKEELLKKYPTLDDVQALGSYDGGATYQSVGDIIRWSDSSYAIGNSYSKDDPRYWFGKTVFLSACSTISGIRADNFTTTGKDARPSSSSDLSILICESIEETTSITFKKVDSATGKTIAGATYGLFLDYACSIPVSGNAQFTIKSDGTCEVKDLAKDVYYVKELVAPSGYQLSDAVIKVDATGDGSSVSVTLYNDPVDATVMVQKVDAYTKDPLSTAKFEIHQYNKNTGAYEKLVELKYDNTIQAFTTTESLKYTETNTGLFKLVETKTPTGYYNDFNEQVFSIVPGHPQYHNGRWMGNNAIVNTPYLSLTVLKVDENGTPLRGAKIKFKYNGKEETLTTGSDGTVVFKNLQETATMTGILYEEAAPSNEYIILQNYKDGQSIKLSKTGENFVTIVNIKNTPEIEIETAKSGTIKIHKRDMNRFDIIDKRGVGVPDTYYSIYTALNADGSVDKTSWVKVDINGNALPQRYMTDANGDIVVDNLPLGAYYVREVEAPHEYAIQAKTFTVMLTENFADENGNVTVEVGNAGDRRQQVVLQMQKVTTVTINGQEQNKPVAGAIYELRAGSELDTSAFNYNVKPGTLLGYYRTDENGMIVASSFGSDAIYDENGNELKPAVQVYGYAKDDANYANKLAIQTGEVLVNGLYYFIECVDGVPENYNLNLNPVEIHAEYKANNTEEPILFTSDDGAAGMVSQTGLVLYMPVATAHEERQRICIEFVKTDAEKQSGTNGWYGLNDYDSAVDNGLAATLEGAWYQIINVVDVVDLETGLIVPAGTVMDRQATDENGHFISKELPNGEYTIVEESAPTGYALNRQVLNDTIKAYWQVGNPPVKTINATSSDEILKQAITINKVSDAGIAMRGVPFEVYSVAKIIEATGVSASELEFMNREQFEELVRGVSPVSDLTGKNEFVTGSDGKITTGLFVYGDYILHEKYAGDDFIAADPIYVRLPSVAEYAEGSAEEEGGPAPDLVIVRYNHDVDEQPTTPYEQTVVNFEIIDFTVSKIWDDNNNEDGLRPNSIEVQLHVGITNIGEPVTLSSENGFSYTWHDLRKYTDAGELIQYAVTELGVPSEYQVSYSYANDGSGAQITNTYEPGQVNVTVHKTWSDHNNQDGIRPTYIDVQLKMDGENYGDPVRITEDMGWTYQWTDLDQFVNGSVDRLINYTVEEVDVPEGYLCATGGDGYNFEITNIHDPEKTSFSVEKIWEDNNNVDRKRPDAIEVELFANGQLIDTVTVSKDDGWKYEWTNLDMYNNGNKVEYTVQEKAESIPNGYESNVVAKNGGATIINSIDQDKTTITVVKNWNDNDNRYSVRPDSVIVHLLANGNKVETYTLTAAEGWAHTWTSLDVRDSDGEIEYTVIEDSVEKYDLETNIKEGNVITLTNKCNFAPTTTFSVTKMWDDQNDRYGLRPEKVVVQLYSVDEDGNRNPNGTPVELSGDVWTYTWNSLPTDIDGHPLNYVVEELSVVPHYDTLPTVYDAENPNVATITNRCTYQPMTSFTVTKHWNDNSDEFGFRPETVKVQLFVTDVNGNTKTCGSVVELNAEHDWTYTWTELHADDDNGELIYTVSEVDVAQYYEVESIVYDEVNKNIATITNKCTYVKTTVIFSKYTVIDAEKKAVPGAKLQILDANGNVVTLANGTVCEWITSAESANKDEFGISGHMIDHLPAGMYLLHEAETPDGYTTAKDIPFEVKETTEIQYVYMEEAPLSAEFSKIDGSNGMFVIGAELQIFDDKNNPVLDASGNPIVWTTTNSEKVIWGLSAGKYVLKEIKTPSGYQKASDVEFEIVNYVKSASEPVKHVSVKMIDNRTFGALSINKVDAETGNALVGVEFELISVNEVIDPVTNNVIYAKGAVVATLVTDTNGHAEIANLPIGVYGPDGFTQIQYKLVETKAASGAQYDPSEIECEVVFAYNGDNKPVIHRDFNFKNNRPVVTVTKDVLNIDTFVGQYEDKNNVTVVKNGDRIDYVIYVKNSGAAPAWNVVVRDEIPVNTEFDNSNKTCNGEYDVETNTVYWTVDKVEPGETVELKFSVVITNEKACEIVNIAEYAMPEEKPTTDKDLLDPKNDENEWIETDAVVHQTIEFHKESVVPGGKTKDDATLVAPGDTIKYRLTFKAVGEVYNVTASDVLPKGVTYVQGSATINGKVDAGVKLNPDLRKLEFSTIDVNNQIIVFEFDVTVDDIPVGEEKTYFENIALVEYSERGEDGDKKTEDSEVITHYTDKNFTVEKHGVPATYEGDASKAHDATVMKAGEEIIYNIKVTNTGDSAIANIVVKDKVPSGLEYLSHEKIDGVKIWVDEESDTITWLIEKLDTKKDVTLSFKAKVKEQKAQLIVNTASYGTITNPGENCPELPNDSSKTQDVVHQVIEFHKTSDVVGGTNKTDAAVVSVGDTITYTLELIAKNNLTSVVIDDVIPEGLKFVPGSAMMKELNETEWTKIPDENTFVAEANADKMVFEIKEMEAGTYYFKFDTVVEHIPVNTEKFYINQAVVEYDKTPNDPSNNRDELESEEVTHMTASRIEGNKTGVIPTYIGDYESKENVTVVEHGDELVYEIVVTNTGVSDLHNLVIRDKLPEHTKFVKADDGGSFDKETGYLWWVVDTLGAGKSVTVKFTVECVSGNKATEIRNKASYAIPEDMENIKDDEWIWTDEVIYQTVSISKTASISHGVDATDAPNVAIGSKFTYVINFESTNTVYGLVVSDAVPKGLSFIEGTATFTLQGGEKITVNDLKVDENGVLTFPAIAEVPAGKTVFTFDVKVEDVSEYDRDYYYINKATATLKESKESNEVIDLVTNTVSHKAIKTDKTPTPVLGFETTSGTTIWALVAIISACAAIAFGYYGFVDNKKRK